MKSLGATTLRWTTEKKISIWLVQEAWTGVGVDHDGVGKRLGQAVDGGLAAVGGAVVDDPEDTFRAGPECVLAQPAADGGGGDRAGDTADDDLTCQSGHDQRDSGVPVSAGSWQARALTSATCTGVKRRGRPQRQRSARAARPPSAKRTRQVRTVSRCAPVSRAIAALPRPPGSLQHDLRPQAVTVRGPVAVGRFLEPAPFGGGQDDWVRDGYGQGRQAVQQKRIRAPGAARIQPGCWPPQVHQMMNKLSGPPIRRIASRGYGVCLLSKRNSR